MEKSFSLRERRMIFLSFIATALEFQFIKPLRTFRQRFRALQEHGFDERSFPLTQRHLFILGQRVSPEPDEMRLIIKTVAGDSER